MRERERKRDIEREREGGGGYRDKCKRGVKKEIIINCSILDEERIIVPSLLIFGTR